MKIWNVRKANEDNSRAEFYHIHYCGSNCFLFWSGIFVLFEAYVRFQIFSSVRVTEWPPIGKIAVYDMFSWYKYLSVILVFSHPSVYGVGISF